MTAGGRPMDARRGRSVFLGAAAGLLGAWAAEARAQSGPAGYWKGDDGSPPTVAIDSSPNARHGTYSGGATTDPSVPTVQFPNPTSMRFNGNPAFVDVPNFPWPTGGPVTVAFWNFVATAEVQNSSVFTVGNQDGANRFQVHAPWGDQNIYWDYGNITGTGRVSTAYGAFLNRWTHVAVVSQGNGGTFRGLYLDGVLRVSATTSDGPDIALSGLQIGRWGGPTLYHRGRVDDFRIYNRVLTAQQIQMLANGLTEPGAPTGLTANPGSGSVILAWTAVTGVSGYNVKRSGTAGGPYMTVGMSTVPSHIDGGLVNGTPYHYVVAAVGVGEGPNSTEASAIPMRGLDLSEGREGIRGGKCELGAIGAGGGAAGWWMLAWAAAAVLLLRRR